MTENKKRCWNCGYFKAYYTRAYCSFCKENNGFCAKNDKIVEKSESCDKWFFRYTPREKRLRLVLNSLPEICQKIETIEDFLAEEREREKIKKVLKGE